MMMSSGFTHDDVVENELAPRRMMMIDGRMVAVAFLRRVMGKASIIEMKKRRMDCRAAVVALGNCWNGYCCRC